MFDFKQKRAEFSAKFEAIKTLSENKTDEFNQFTKNLDSSFDEKLNQFGSNIGAFADKNKKKLPNVSNLFDTLSNDLQKVLKIDPKNGESVLRRITRESVNDTTKEIKNVVVDNLKKVLFANDTNFGCGISTPMPTDQITIKPEEFDFFGVLKINPSTNLGGILYEDNKYADKLKFNKDLYSTFDSNAPYTFVSAGGNDLFSITWSSNNQHYVVSGLTGGNIGALTTVDQFISQYYETIEFPKPSDIIKGTINMMLHGDGSQPHEMDVSFNEINRLLNKIMSVCGTPRKDDELQENPINQFNEDDIDPEFFFDFDSVEGIDLDDESLRYKRVMRFKDCNNLEVPVNSAHINDFVYLANKKGHVEALNATLNKVAKDASLASDGSIHINNIHISLNSFCISSLVKAMLGSVFSPKLMLPFAILWKLLKAATSQTVTGVKKLFKYFSKVIFGILQDIFYKFITIFWKKVKPELINMIIDFVPRIFKNAKKKYIRIIKSLIRLLALAIPFIDIKNCNELYEQMLKLLGLLNVGVKTKINGFLLQAAQLGNGYSEDRALINMADYCKRVGIEVGEKYGKKTNVLDFLNAAFKGHNEEFDENHYVETSLSFGTIPVAPGGGSALITPMLKAYGKVR